MTDGELDLGLRPPAGSEPFPWPVATTDEAPSSSKGLALAQTWPGLTPAERGVALFVGDGCSGPGSENALCAALGIPRHELDDLLWSMSRKGYLTAVAAWWAR